MEKFKCLAVDAKIEEKFMVLAGLSKHHSTQKSYYYETSYKVFKCDENIVINDEGQAMVFEFIAENSWFCHSKLCFLHEDVLYNVKYAYKILILKSTVDMFKLISDKGSEFLSSIKILNDTKAHFPKVRSLIRNIYQLAFYCKNINKSDYDLKAVNVEKLKEIGIPLRNTVNFEVNNEDLNLNDIQ